MKVSGAVAMADDPGHAFGMYFEKIEPIKFDAQEDKPQFNPSEARWDNAFSLSRDIAYIKNSAEFRYNLRLAHKLNLIDELLKPDAP